MFNRISISSIFRRLAKKYGNYDSFFMIERAAEMIKNGCGGIVRYQRLFELLSNFVLERKTPFDEKSLISFLQKEAEKQELTFNELCSVPEYLVLIALNKVSKEKASDEKLENCLMLLRVAQSIDTEELISSVSFCEQFLLDSGELYSKNDDKTKENVRKNISKRAKKLGLSELDAAKEMSEEHLYERKLPFARYLHLPVIYSFSAVICALCLAFGVPIITVILLFLPLTELIKQISDIILGRFIPNASVPRLKLNDVPDDASTLIVLTALVNEDNIEDLVNKIEGYSLCNNYYNTKFALLADFADSASPKIDENEKISRKLKEKIRTLNEARENKFGLFIRPQIYSESESKFMGWERKRGAIVELVALSKGKTVGSGKGFETAICDSDFLGNVKYVITLDSDTRLYPGAVLDMVSAMAHPLNAPVILDGRVISGYGVMQPRTETSLESAGKTSFSLMQSEGGSDIYSFASYETYMALYGDGIFCGKGIIDVDVFEKTCLCGFPENTILSHDILEGAMLRTAALTDVPLTDGSPKNPISHYKRLHRWIRGDIQNAVYALVHAKDNVENNIDKISLLSKYKIFDNIRRAFVPILCILALISTCFFEGRNAEIAALLSVLYILYRPIIEIMTSPRALFRRFFGFTLTSVERAVLSSTFDLISLGYTAQVTLDAVARSIYRMFVSRRDLLEWTTADSADKKRLGLYDYVVKMCPSSLLGAAVLIFSNSVIASLVGLTWILFPIVAFFLGKENKKRKRKTCKLNREAIKKYVFDTWKYYEATTVKNDNYLPPDNRQLSPVEATAHRTSPTNIGLYLLSCLAVRDFGFIDSEGLYCRVRNTLDTVERLAKFSGHLYNWYDTETLDVLGGAYVSTVDSGNFITSLVALENGLCEYLHEEPRLWNLIVRIKELRKNCDFRILYNEKKKLFSIGYDTLRSELSENCYDLLMSEARTTSYYAIASGILPREHWSRLGRPFISEKGYVGTASWTGTMFEYFMPSLLLPTPEGSLSYEALKFALYQQKRSRKNGLWGKSESGYYAFDPSMNYLYRAFGVQKLGIKKGLDNDSVISPYSSFLVLSWDPQAASSNLEKMKNIGMYGECGFYEAVDFTQRRIKKRSVDSAVIRSYMAHHTGMSIVAAANACFDDIFIIRFFRSPEIAAARELLEEKVCIHAKKPLKVRRSVKRRLESSRKQSIKPLEKTQKSGERNTAVISNGSARITASSEGFIQLDCGDDALCVNSFTDGRKNGFRIFVENEGVLTDITDDADFYSTRSEIIYKKKVNKTIYRVRLAIHPHYKCFLASVSAENVFGSVCPMMTFEPIMTNYKSYKAHPAFSALSVESEFSKEDGAVIFRRLPRLENEPERNMCIAFGASPQDFEFLTRKDPSLPLGYEESDVKNLINKRFEKFTGACITPFCAVKKRSEKVSGRYYCDFLISYGQSANEAASVVRSIRNEGAEARKKRRKSVSPFSRCFKLPLNLPSAQDFEAKWLSSMLLNSVTARKFACSNYSGVFFGPEELWCYGVSGDVPIVTLNIQEEFSSNDSICRTVGSFLEAHRSIMFSGVRFDVVILYKGSGEYFDKSKRALEELTDRIGSPFLSARNGGIFLISTKDNDLSELFRLWSSYYCDIGFDTVSERLISAQNVMENEQILSDGSAALKNRLPFIRKSPSSVSAHQKSNETDTIEIPGGCFVPEGFTLRKKEVDLPFSYVYANPIFGTLLTQNSLGYTWKENCHTKRITPWNCDGYSEPDGEVLILAVNGERYDMCACSEKVTFGYGFAEYSGTCGGVKYTVSVGVDPRLPVKMLLVNTNGGKVSLEIKPLMANSYGKVHTVQTRYENGVLYFKNPMSAGFRENGFIYRTDYRENNVNIDASGAPTDEENGCETCFFVGAFPTGGEKVVSRIIEKYKDAASVKAGFTEYEKRAFSFETDIILKSNYPSLDLMINRYLPYQAKIIRMTARGGFYQSGGAFGFRDQLQDSLAALYFDPKITRRQIIRSACHQYTEGDVMHWWHESRKGPLGVRTRCSDDYLWLPFVTAIYVKETGDTSILDIALPYVESPPLKIGELERCERPRNTKRKETLFLHCLRAIELAISLQGRHGLPLIGTGDWNDGMNMVGAEGQGESVWLGFFLYYLLGEFTEICKIKGEKQTVESFINERKALISALNRAFCKDRFTRAYYDDGTALGTEESNCCKIDLLPQAFSAITGAADDKKIAISLETAKNELYDAESGILKLFSPPFSRKRNDKNNPGYIQGYVPGIRENGGQYTHAAVWGAWAYLISGDVEFGTRLIMDLNPIQKYLDGKGKEYRGEPYFMAGDVYSNDDYKGRAGWTLYTGAAAWYYRVILSELLGFKLCGDSFTVNPRLSTSFDSFELTLLRNGCEYTIVASLGDKTEYFLDGELTKNHFTFDKTHHILKITVEKTEEIV